jgi:hypothetical protein
MCNDAIAATLDAEPAPETATKQLLALATQGEASDNITLLVVRFDAADDDAARGIALDGDGCAFPSELARRCYSSSGYLATGTGVE